MNEMTTPSLSKLDMLIIRACKSKDPEKRLESIYRRFWCIDVFEKERANCLINRIINILEQETTVPFRYAELIDLSRPSYWDTDSSWERRVFNNLITKVRYTESKYFPEMIWPIRYRREK